MIVDLENNRLSHTVGDEGDIIPKKLQKCLVAALQDDPGKEKSEKW